jgi:DNA-directed RNA polymerase specialized sigma24 family protein
MSHIRETKPSFELAVPRQDRLLEQYYERLQEWALLLTRGDVSKAQDIVHELCLHLTLSAPDLSKVQNLNAYLYTCLRHIFLSDIARSAREALYSLRPDDFDSVQMAIRSQPAGDPVQQQNDLRRICAYAIWRKAQTKSASYFILRFFHGYYRRDVATIAGVPLSSIDPKLNKIRSEIHLYLREPGKLQFTNRELPPSPRLYWVPLSSQAVFKELRETVLLAREGECLTEDELLAHYRTPQPAAISCSLLSHIVSCERCLSVIDQHFNRPTLKDREPLDGLGSSSDEHHTGPQGAQALRREAMFRSVRRHGSEILDHHPRTLSIAVDGKILASRDVRSEKSMLSARIERPENTNFIEVFSEQGIRLALLSIIELPPDSPHQRVQRVALSDDRWLELTLTFDGLGLNSEVTYFDPSLSVQSEEDAPESVVIPQIEPGPNLMPWPGVSSFGAVIRRLFCPVLPPVAAWSLLLACIFCVAGYYVYRHEHPAEHTLNARQLLSHSIQIEAANLKGQTEHQVLHFEERSVDGNVLSNGTIDLWRDGDDKRHMRRLYDEQHRLVAAEWVQRDGQRGQYPQAGDSLLSNADRKLIADEYWKQDMSPSAFRGLNGENAEMRSTEDGYALTVGPGAAHPQLISATLVFDHHFHPTREIMRVRSGNDIREIHFVEADYERRPSWSVPDAIFDPRDQGLRSGVEGRPPLSEGSGSQVQLTELNIAVLYQLSNLNADSSEPIEVERTSDGHIRVAGMVANDDRKREIESRLNLLHNHQLLRMQVASPSDLKNRAKGPLRPLTGVVSTYYLGQTSPLADGLLREYFEKQGLSGDSLDAAVAGFSHEVLGRAQRALQNTFALKRLSQISSQSDLRYISLSSQQQWTEMVVKHASALEVELRALREQLSRLSASSEPSSNTGATDVSIESPAQFARAVDQLLARVRSLDQRVGRVFASSQTQEEVQADVQLAIAATNRAIPLQQSVEMTSFVTKLKSSARTITDQQLGRLEEQTPDRP